MTNDLFKELQNAEKELLQTVAAFDQEQFNTTPSFGGWTAGQVAEHLRKSYGLKDLLLNPGKPADRPADKNVEGIRSAFLNFNIKFQSPEFIVPEKKAYDKARHLADLESALKLVENGAQKINLSELCIGFSFPNMGELTKLELINFINCHTMRHTHQLKNIYKDVAARAKGK